MAAHLLVRSLAFGRSLLRRVFDRAPRERDSYAQVAPALAQNLGRICARSCAWTFDRKAWLFFRGLLLGQADHFVDRRSFHREGQRADRRADRFRPRAYSTDRSRREPAHFPLSALASKASGV